MTSNSNTLGQDRDFLKLWAGQSISEFGSRITRDGLPYAAVLVLGATPAQMGILVALSGISVLLFGLAAGVWVDRLRRRPIMIGADVGRAVLIATIPLAALRGSLGMPQLYVVASLAGVLTVFFDVAYQSYLPSLVGRDRLIEGNSKLMMSATAAEIAGPGLTGLLVQWITAPIAILFDAISFLFSALSVALIRRPEPAPAPQTHENLWDEALSGLRFIRGNDVLRALAARSLLFFFSMGTMGALYVLYALTVLRLRPAALGFAIAMGGVGGTLGALASHRAVKRFGLGRTLLGSSLLIALGTSLMPLAHGGPALGLTFLIGQQLLGDFGMAVYFINETSLRQATAPAHVLGRVNAGMQLLSRGVLPLGALVGGVLGGRLGVRPTIAASVALASLSIAWLLRPSIRRLESLEPAQAL